ncbi:M23 family metallopeptidase [Candidatus Spongiihabitans sp.]|uniref:M23 family metallopeptidase n=1 Tax=Candidatus Spongiihabitans sp. TaxID=3101308 RepID=UPI003C7B5696
MKNRIKSRIKNRLKNHLAITISDVSGSKHFFLKTTAKRNLIIASVVVLVIVLTSFSANVFQSSSIALLAFEQENLSQELVRFDSVVANLNQIADNHRQQVANINKELVEIEKFSGVNPDDLAFSLEQRIKLIGNFYNAKEEKYAEIGSRVRQIEKVVGLSEKNSSQEESDLASRVDLASLTASQERILHDSIPNGYPLERHVITSHFGMRKHPLTKVKSFHNGVDLRAKTSQKVFATADGFISNADYSDINGKRIVVLHNFGFETRYSHLKEMLVSAGDVIRRGDLMGYSGNTGRISAPHLHYEIRHLGKPIDPLQFLEWEFGAHEIFTQVRGIKWPSLISLINKQITHQTLQLSQLDRTLLVK